MDNVSAKGILIEQKLGTENPPPPPGLSRISFAYHSTGFLSCAKLGCPGFCPSMVDAEEMQDLVQIQSSKGLGERISGPKAMISSIQVASVMAVDIWGTWFILHNGVPSHDSLLKRTFQGGANFHRTRLCRFPLHSGNSHRT